MDQDQIQRMERLERQNERLEKQNDELREQMKQLLEAMASMTRARTQEEGQTSNQGTPVYPSGFEPTETTQATGTENVTAAPSQLSVPSTFPLPPPFGGGPYSYNCGASDSKKGAGPKKQEGETNVTSSYWSYGPQSHQPSHYLYQQPSLRPRYRPYSYQPPYQPSYRPPCQLPNQQPYQPYPIPATNFIATTPTYQPAQTPRSRPNTSTNYQKPYRPQTPRLHIDPLPAPYTYSQLLPQLVQQGLIQISPYTKTVNGPPYPTKHNPNVRCDYHGGSTGHSTEECDKLKSLVQRLIDEGNFSFQKNAQPDVGPNPLPNHDGENVNIIGEWARIKGSGDDEQK